MARIFYGKGKGFVSKLGFTDPNNPKSFNVEIVRPPFTINGTQFVRDTGALNDTPMPFGAEGNQDYITEAATATDLVSATTPILRVKVTEVASAMDTVVEVSLQSIDGELVWPNLDWRVAAEVSAGNIITGALIWPEWVMEAYTGGEGELIWPEWVVEALGNAGLTVAGNLIWPGWSVDGALSSENIMSGDLRWPGWNVEGRILSGISLAGDLVWPEWNVLSFLLPGYYSDGDLIWPEWNVEGVLSQGSILSGNLIWPGWSVDGIVRVEAAAPSFTCLVLNINNKAISRYSHHAFTGFIHHKGRYLATDGATGIYELVGDTDNGTKIMGTLKFRLEDLDANGRKHKIREVWVTCRHADDLEAYLQEHEGRIIQLHKIETIKKGLLTEVRFKAPRGLRGRFYSLILKGTNKYDLNTVRLFDDEMAYVR